MKAKYIFYIFSLLLIIQLPAVAQGAESIIEFELFDEKKNSAEDTSKESTFFNITSSHRLHTFMFMPFSHQISLAQQDVIVSIFRPPISI